MICYCNLKFFDLGLPFLLLLLIGSDCFGVQTKSLTGRGSRSDRQTLEYLTDRQLAFRYKERKLSVIHVLLIVEGKKHGKAGSSICFHRFLELSLKLRIAGLRKKEIANSKAWFPAFSLEISAMAAPPNLRPLFRTRWCSGLSFLLITSTRGYVGEDGGEKYNWERYAERFTKHL
ncbi:hypothetical protein COP2_034949 [Malus domestica]